MFIGMEKPKAFFSLTAIAGTFESVSLGNTRNIVQNGSRYLRNFRYSTSLHDWHFSRVNLHVRDS